MRDTTIDLISDETDRAHGLHGLGFEQSTPDVKLRILVEEVGEIARAIQDISNAERKRREASREGTTEQLEAARKAVREAEQHLVDEVIQVGSLAVRWLESFE